ncbi:precorrin-2 C(20)-methyltransferase [Sulfurimonas sediminis]|uniref:Precorrin-2 C(20)-methyltransferase n=1 Tax=Sulfurimonas sediminis TaxID=2590020 RepID=A0A7M1AYN6_9BACT|nr:precorrin-2 C(20)-methyltransferase [Sulfurimonas sediminis]QOP42560.1 precorrin-2 C(20)-methyltransferase [Sulfurimonas sediminis]
MNQKLTMVSLGPGDVELLTLKALNAFKECDAICVPTKSQDNSFTKSISYKIVSNALKLLHVTKPIIPVYSPMHFIYEDWVHEADIILETLQKYEKICFVTLGDAAIYSSIYYLLDIIKKKNKKIYESCEVIPGVTSFSAASAEVQKALCLGDEELTIKPINPRGKVKTTEILMRPKIGMDTEVLGEGDFYTFENMYLEDAKITSSKIAKVKKYMTLFINFARR